VADNIWNAGKGGSSSGGSGSSGIWGAGSGGSKGKSKMKGVRGLTPVDRAIGNAAKGVAGALGSAIGGLQQVAFKGLQAGNLASQGELGAAGKAALGALGEVGTLGQAGGDIDFAQAMGKFDNGKITPAKLPRGLNTTVGVVADPLNFLTFGTGAAAKTAGKQAMKTLGEEAAERLATQGFKKGLTTAEKTTLRNALVDSAALARNPEKTADKMLKELSLRGRGGVTVRVPGTHIGGTALSGETAAKVGEKTGLTAAKGAVKNSPVGKTVRAALIPGARVEGAHGAKASEELLAALDAKGAAETNRVNDLVTRWNSAVKDFEQTAGAKFTPAEDSIVSRALQSGDVAAAKAANPELARLIDTGDSIRKGTFEANVEAGTLADGISVGDDGIPTNAARDQETYMHRTRNPEVVKALGDEAPGGLYEGRGLSKSMTPGSAKARTIAPDAADHEINEAINLIRRSGTDAVPAELISEADLPAVEAIARKMDKAKLPLDTPYYRESAVASLVESGVEGARAVETSRMLEGIRGIKSENGVSILHNPEDLKALGVEPTKEALKDAGLVEFEVPKLGKFYATPEVKSEITKFSTIMEDDIVGKTKKALNTWDRWWRGQVTASLPGGVPFASRNARTNVMLTVLDGMNPKYFVDGGKFQLRAAKVVKNHAAEIAEHGVEATMAKHLGARDFKLWKAAREYGVVGDGFYNIDITDAPTIRAAGMPKSGGKLKRGARFVAGSHGTMATKGRALNQAVEQHARMSHFLYSVDRLGDLEQAAARTNTVLFDYSRVTPFEQKIAKKVMPFWTFMRKNIPGQLRAFIENPVRVALPEKLSAAMSDQLPEGSPEYQRRAGAHVSKLPGLAGLITTPERPLQAAASALEAPAQLVAGILPGSQGAIEPEGGLPQAFRSMVSQVGGGPAAAAKALIEEGTGKSSFTGFNLKPEEMTQRLLAAGYPQIGRAPALTGRLPDAVVTSSTKKKAKLKMLAQIAASLGIKVEFPTDGAASSSGTKSSGTASIWGAGKR
jgi:hypothetical protein